MHDIGGSPTYSPQGSDIEVPADFKTEYHSRSGCLPLLQAAKDFSHLDAPAMQSDEQPWQPFKTKANLEFTDIAIQAGLNASHVNALLSIISQVADKSASVTFKNENELRWACDQAAQELTPVCSLPHFWFTVHHNSSISSVLSSQSWMSQLSIRRNQKPSRYMFGHCGIGCLTC